MPPIVLALIAAAAVMHAAWNVILKRSGDPLITSGRAMIAGTLAFAPFAVVAWLLEGRPAIPVAAIALGFVSGIFEVIYLILLSGAYRRGDLSVVYPIARGTGPLLAILAGVILLGERLGLIATFGVGALVVALLIVQRPWRVLRGGSRRLEGAAPWAFACGVSIASYSTVDRVGARLTEPWLYAAVLFVFIALGMAGVIIIAGRRERSGESLPWRPSTAAGMLAVATYVLILIAFSIAPLSVVAPLRESAIVIGSAWGVLRMGEGHGRSEAARRIAAALLVVLGAVLLAIPS